MAAPSSWTWTDLGKGETGAQPTGGSTARRPAAAGFDGLPRTTVPPPTWTDEDEADIVRTKAALERMLFPRRAPVNGEHAETIRFQRESCVRGLARMYELKAQLTA